MRIIKPAKNNTSGFIMLLSLLVISMMLIIALSVTGIVAKEIKISTLGRESQKAFYAANAGVECVIYWNKETWDEVAGTTVFSGTEGGSITCAKNDIEVSPIDLGANELESVFQLNLDNGSCAGVRVNKKTFAPGDVNTLIRSDGYNLPCSAGDNTGKVQRTLQASFLHQVY